MSEFTSCGDCENEKHAHICIHCSNNPQVTNLFKPKPKQKIIKLYEMVGSDIDMEFTNLNDFEIQPYHTDIGFLTGFDNSTNKMYSIKNEVVKYYKCRIRQDHVHFYNKKENPLPDGLLVKLYLDNGYTQTHKSQDIRWDSGRPNIIGFEIMEVLPEYKYEWEKEE